MTRPLRLYALLEKYRPEKLKVLLIAEHRWLKPVARHKCVANLIFNTPPTVGVMNNFIVIMWAHL